MKNIYKYIFIPLVAVFVFSCNSEEDNLLGTQQTQIENYLNNNRMDDYERINNIYRYVIADPDAPRNENTRAREGDSVFFHFAAYQFTSTRVEPTFYTNFDYLVDELKADSLNTIIYPTEAEAVKLGRSKLIKALEIGMTDCFEKDSIRLFLTFNLAYGDHYVSTLPYNSAVEYVIKIDEVKKQ